MIVYRLTAHLNKFNGTFASSDGSFETQIALSKSLDRIEKMKLDLFGKGNYGYDDDTPYITACRENRNGTFDYEGHAIPRIPIDSYYGSGSLSHATVESFEYVSESEFI